MKKKKKRIEKKKECWLLGFYFYFYLKATLCFTFMALLDGGGKERE